MKNKIKYLLLMLILLMLLLIIYTKNIVNFIEYIGVQINYKENLTEFFRSKLLLLIVLLSLLLLYNIYHKFIINIYHKFLQIINKIELKKLFPLLILITIIYLITLIILSVKNYDLGFDEAWYINYAENFSLKGFPYYTHNESCAMIDFITMIPYYIVYFIYRLFFDSSLIGIKIISWLLSVSGLGMIFLISKKQNNLFFAFFVILFIVLQPGFGFVASSFFGEILSIGLVFLAADMFFRKNLNLWPAIWFSVAIHTKFQLFPIIILLLFIMFLKTLDKRIIIQIIYILVLILFIAILRLLPAIIYDDNNIILVIKQFYNMTYNGTSSNIVFFDRIQLFNRFFPLMIFLFSIIFSIPDLKSKFNQFIYGFAFILIVYWIFFFKFTTYRHLFMGIIPLLYILVLALSNIYKLLINKYKLQKTFLSKFIIIFSLLLFLLYGTSTNIIYAMTGYNDGVQFDLSGFKSRLFYPAKNNNYQKDFFVRTKKIIDSNDIIFSKSPIIIKAYLNNKVYKFNYIKKTKSSEKKYIIIGIDTFPDGNFNEAFKRLKALKVNYKLIYKNNGYVLLKLCD